MSKRRQVGSKTEKSKPAEIRPAAQTPRQLNVTPEPHKFCFQRIQWIVTTIIAIIATVAVVLYERTTSQQYQLAKQLSELQAPFLNIAKLGQENSSLPHSVEIKNGGTSTAYYVTLYGIYGSYEPPRKNLGPPARPDAVPLTKVHLLPNETVEATLPVAKIPGDTWKRVLAGREMLNLFFMLSFTDQRGVHTEWFCFEYNTHVAHFVACPQFRGPPDVWVGSLGPEQKIAK